MEPQEKGQEDTIRAVFSSSQDLPTYHIHTQQAAQPSKLIRQRGRIYQHPPTGGPSRPAQTSPIVETTACGIKLPKPGWKTKMIPRHKVTCKRCLTLHATIQGA